ncbi:MAG: hypothetical protein IT258_01910 [Saprospiraceae bacterium]|nr:hypothetical protein [Saprospiraceae bacterium]
MFKNIRIIAAIVLIFNLFGCKNETPSVTGEPLPTGTEQAASGKPGTTNVNFISKEKIVFNDNSPEIVFPKETDTSSLVIYFTLPAENAEGKSALSEDGLFRSQVLTTIMAKAGLAMVYAEGNSALQTVTQLARANYSELNIFKADQAEETLKSLIKSYKARKVMVCASAPVLTQMIGQLTGKPTTGVVTAQNTNIYVIISKGIGDGEVKTINY